MISKNIWVILYDWDFPNIKGGIISISKLIAINDQIKHGKGSMEKKKKKTGDENPTKFKRYPAPIGFLIL